MFLRPSIISGKPAYASMGMTSSWLLRYASSSPVDIISTPNSDSRACATQQFPSYSLPRLTRLIRPKDIALPYFPVLHSVYEPSSSKPTSPLRFCAAHIGFENELIIRKIHLSPRQGGLWRPTMKVKSSKSYIVHLSSQILTKSAASLPASGVQMDHEESFIRSY